MHIEPTRAFARTSRSLALAGALLALATTATPSAPVSWPGPTPHQAPGGETTSPGDPFSPWSGGKPYGRPPVTPKPYTWTLECHGVVNDDGTITFTITNLSDRAVRRMGTILIQWGDGKELGHGVDWEYQFPAGGTGDILYHGTSSLPPGSEVDCVAFVAD